MIDTGSARSALALLDAGLRPVREIIGESGRGFDVAAQARELIEPESLTAIAVAKGPGSFTGLRSGAAYAVGLALGLGLPLRPFRSLDLQAARARWEATAVADAGRGRLYYLPPGGEPALGEVADLPRERPVAGWLRPATAAAVEAAGLTLRGDAELLTFGAAAADVVARAPEIPCDRLTIEYMQSTWELR